VATENIHTYPNQREVIGKFKRERESKKNISYLKKEYEFPEGLGGLK